MDCKQTREFLLIAGLFLLFWAFYLGLALFLHELCQQQWPLAQCTSRTDYLYYFGYGW